MRWILRRGIPPVPHNVHYVRRVPLPASNHNNNSIQGDDFFLFLYRRRTLEPALKTNSFCDAPADAQGLYNMSGLGSRRSPSSFRPTMGARTILQRSRRIPLKKTEFRPSAAFERFVHDRLTGTKRRRFLVPIDGFFPPSPIRVRRNASQRKRVGRLFRLVARMCVCVCERTGKTIASSVCNDYIHTYTSD